MKRCTMDPMGRRMIVVTACILLMAASSAEVWAQAGGGGGNTVITGVVQEWVRDRPWDPLPRAQPLENATVIVAFILNATFNARYTIQLRNDQGCRRCEGKGRQARTDRDGRFRVSVPSGGRVDIHITKRGYVPHDRSSVLMEGTIVNLGLIDLGKVRPGHGGLAHHQEPTFVRKQLTRADPPCCSNYGVPSRGIGDSPDPVAGDVSGEPSGRTSGEPSGRTPGVPSGTARPERSILFLVDTSGSMNERGKMQQAIDALKSAVTQSDDGKTEWSIARFTNCTATVTCRFTMDASKVRAAADRLRATGCTPYFYAIALGTRYLATEGRGRVGTLVVLADGIDTCGGPGRCRSNVGLGVDEAAQTAERFRPLFIQRRSVPIR